MRRLRREQGKEKSRKEKKKKKEFGAPKKETRKKERTTMLHPKKKYIEIYPHTNFDIKNTFVGDLCLMAITVIPLMI
jgi:hypothetical protein